MFSSCLVDFRFKKCDENLPLDIDGSLAWCQMIVESVHLTPFTSQSFHHHHPKLIKICFWNVKTTSTHVKVQDCLSFMGFKKKVFCSSQVMQIRCKSAVCQCHGYQSLTLMDFFFLGHICNSVYILQDWISILNQVSAKNKKKTSRAELWSDQLLFDWRVFGIGGNRKPLPLWKSCPK